MHRNRHFKILLLLNTAGKKQTAEFASEEELVEFLKETYCTAAPLSFEYSDGSPVEAAVINRIYEKVFSS